MRLVVDCSITMAWFLDEGSRLADAVLSALERDEAIVPGIWPLETANSLAVGERKGRLTAAEVAQALDLIRGLSIAIDGETCPRALGETLSLARTQRLSAYDASYLELAMREGAELATADKALQEAAIRVGVKLFQP
jgi:predicted nucleic acid-binding protein